MDETIIVQEEKLTKPAYELSVRTHRVYRLISFLLGAVETLLLFRFFLKLLGANSQSAFVSVIYALSGTLLLPFSGVFQRSPVAGPATVNVFEPSILVAMIAYAIAAWGVARLLLIVRSRPRS